jgi:sugar phosphate permease
MDEVKYKRVIQGIFLINAAIFLLAAFCLTESGSFSYVVGDNWDYLTSLISSRKNWEGPFMILLCSSLLSAGIFRISILPKKDKQVQVGKKEVSSEGKNDLV